jgi:hypothetical protein
VLLAASQALAPALERRERAEQAANAYDEAIKHRMPWGLVPLPKGDPTAWPAALPYMANPNPACRVPDADRRALLDELVGAVRERGVGLVLIHPAYRNSRPHRCVLTEIARRRGVRVVEFERIVRAMGAPKHEVFIDVFHPTAQAHRRLAEELARVVRPLIESPPQGRRSARARPPRRRPARAGRALQGAQRLR